MPRPSLGEGARRNTVSAKITDAEKVHLQAKYGSVSKGIQALIRADYANATPTHGVRTGVAETSAAAGIPVAALTPSTVSVASTGEGSVVINHRHKAKEGDDEYSEYRAGELWVRPQCVTCGDLMTWRRA